MKIKKLMFGMAMFFVVALVSVVATAQVTSRAKPGSSVAGTQPLPPNLPKSFTKVKTLLQGTVNGEPILGRGTGMYDQATGELLVTYNFEEFPPTLNKVFVWPLPITGYIPAARALTGVRNPFQVEGDNKIHYTRTITFAGTNDIFVLKANCDKRGDTVTSTFEVSGNVPEGALSDAVGVDPIIELWSPGQNGVTYGSFPIHYFAADGKRVVALASSEYYIEAAAGQFVPLTTSVQRYITINSKVSGNQYTHRQVSTLFSNVPGHSPELKVLPKFLSTVSY